MDGSCLFCLTVLFSGLVGAPAPRPLGATEHVYFDFRVRPDRDFIRPDDWLRVIQPGYPFYIDAVLTDEAAAVGTRSLVFRLNGGHCAYFSPLIPATTDYNYVLQAQIKTVGLVGDEALVLLEFLDRRRRLLGQQHLSGRISGTQDWTAVRVGPVAPPSEAVKHLRIACLTQHGVMMDLSGSVYFDDLWVGRLPRFSISTSSDYRVFEPQGPKQAELRVTGLEGRKLTASFELLDCDETPVGQSVAEIVAGSDDAGTAQWQLPMQEVGFYHLCIALDENKRRVLTRSFPLSVMRPLDRRPARELGLSAPAPRHGLKHYEQLLYHSGMSLLKIPLWAAAEGIDELSGRTRDFAFFVERIESRGHRIVGALENAPPSVRSHLSQDMPGIANIFSLPKERWSGQMEGVMARFGLKVNQWQLGSDKDTSFENLPRLDEVLTAVKEEMELIGQDVRIGVVQHWLSPPLASPELAFESLCDAPAPAAGERTPANEAPLTAEELGAYIRERKAAEDQTRQLWVQITALPTDQYPRQDRIGDLARRVLAAKVAQADVILATQITDPQRGLIDADGVPSELFTIWRTLAEYLGEATYLGQLFIPARVQSRIFSREGTVTIVLWSDAPQDVKLVVGSEARLSDLWGRQQTFAGNSVTRSIAVGPVPVFVIGASEPLIRFQMALRFAAGHLSSERGKHSDSLVLTNTFPVAMSGRAHHQFPQRWHARPSELRFELGAEESAEMPIGFEIPQGTPQGDFLVPLDFDINADQRYQFRLRLPYRLGEDEVKATATARVLPNGRLEVEMTVTNLMSTPIQLRGAVRAFQRGVHETVIPLLDPNETVTQQVYLPRGAEVIGREIRLELTEVDGRRQFIIVVDRDSEETITGTRAMHGP